MADSLDALILDLLEWIGSGPKPYSEVMDAWRTSCPRLTVWEDANDRGFVERHHVEGLAPLVSLTAMGRGFLETHRGKTTSRFEGPTERTAGRGHGIEHG